MFFIGNTIRGFATDRSTAYSSRVVVVGSSASQHRRGGVVKLKWSVKFLAPNPNQA